SYAVVGGARTLPGPAPANVQITQVFVTSMTVTWTPVPSDSGYSLEAYTDAGFTSFAASSVTTSGTLGSLTVTGLGADTTYYLRVGSLWNGTTNYAPSVPASTSTLTNLLSPSVLNVSSNTVTAGWPAFAVGSGTNTAQGYRFEAYTDAGYTS